MFDLIVWVAIFVVSLLVLVKAADYFTEAAETIGLFFGLPAFIIGVTIVAIGTSLPELASSIFAVFRGSSEIVVGNVVGSNIANIFLVIGASAVLSKKVIKIGYELVHVDLPLLVGSAFLMSIMIIDGKFTMAEGIICLLGFIIYIWYTVSIEKKKKNKDIQEEIEEDVKGISDIKAELKKDEDRSLDIKTVIVLVVSSIFIYLGAQYTVESVIKLSEILNVGREIIAVGAVALGTSLPELTVSINAARKGKPEISVGNVLGSNIFNTFVVMGIPAFFGTLLIPKDIISFSLPVMLMATLLYFFITQDNHITRWEGGFLLLFYVFFIGKLFSLF